MKKNNLYIVIIVLFLFQNISLFCTPANEYEQITFFQTETDKQGWRGVVRGRVVSLGSREIGGKELRQLAQEKTKVTVRLQNRDGILPGDTLFVINERNLIVSKLEVVTIIKSNSFGFLLVGYGNFRRVQKEFLVVQKRDQNISQFAWVHKARGDYYRKVGDASNAVVEYEKAVKKDSAFPEPHIELGYFYLEKGVHEYALREFSEAYKNRGFIQDREDLFRLYKGILAVRSYNAYESPVINRSKRNENILKGRIVSKEASDQFPKESYFFYYLGLFYYDTEKPDDVFVKEQMLKTIQYDPENINAMVILSELYDKHDNADKALMYARMALSLDPTHQRARTIYLKLTR